MNPEGSNWGIAVCTEDSLSLRKPNTDPLIVLPFDQIESCGQFRHDIKVQIKKPIDEIFLADRGETFYTAPCEAKISIGQEQEPAPEDAQPTYASAKGIHSTVTSRLMKQRSDMLSNGSDDVSEALGSSEILRMASIPASNPHGYFDVIVTSSALIMVREKKTNMTDEVAKARYEVPLSKIDCLFLLPFPLNHSGKSHDQTFARKYLVLATTDPVSIGSGKSSYIVFSVDDEDTFSAESPLKTSMTTLEEVQTTFCGKILPAETLWDAEAARMNIIGPKSEILAKVVKGLTGKRVLGQSTFHNATAPDESVAPYVRCMHKSSSGHLYFLEKSFLFLHKPVLFRSYEDIGECSLEIDSPFAKTHTIEFSLKNQGENAESPKNKLKFTNIPSLEGSAIHSWLSTKGISVATETTVEDGMELDSESSDEELDESTQ
mmetsp:Transcript_18173/g.28473  ORF Transcript_18173/g.28473 Transcript_18173/m.28473 type:complete len:433 (-) Transcript_18173:34-1332(-)|eukprot:CAMPEP_0201512046 /NCGR_PEP_ID=MMETSP0161_2-20130828/4394_1 /ASSEMBLY_ACC=CAM_ASM_000251 /TAXON_ID=180227 /ORGANISM="Neoparamoeba aestuarina, Strain SoJaBio B1-5/56/2" /LENGTH=432 /DNA_ID=CAMNT_0047907763 /DNA_START=26 /DNA_END=1324 /DNA_ORIENTATION=+